MRASELTPRRPLLGPHDRSRRILAAFLALAVAAIGLAACGGSGTASTAAESTLTTVAQTTTPITPTVTTPRKPRKRAAIHHSSTTTVTHVTTVTVTTRSTITLPAAPLTPKYVGVSPIGCLQAAGLNRARSATEQGVWEANAGSTVETDRNAIVFVSGPYKDAAKAKAYAQSLLVVELAASGGRWVASASLPSGLGTRVKQVAACMAK